MKLSTLTKLLDRLDEEEIPYTLASLREGTVMVSVTVPDERWEVEFTAEGDVEIEVFTSDGEVHDQSFIEELFKRHAEG